MGEAYDRTGHMLGSAFGDTKREVFDKLMKEHGDAAEVRIRSLGGVQAEMPRYRCHKEVHALKIAEVSMPTSSGGTRLSFTDANFAPIEVAKDWDVRHKPNVGGYYVVYDDGYTSYSPAKAFEDGYTRL